MSDETPRLKLPEPDSMQEMTETTWNESLDRIDALVDLFLLGQFVNAPPASLADGDCYLVGGAPTGAWTGEANRIAVCRDGAWIFCIPFNGLRAYVATTKALLVYQSGVWSDAASAPTGLLDLSAAGQVKFPASQKPSSDPNTLDDYEEGTFTPVLTTSATPPAGWSASVAVGEYVKIGALVFVEARLILTGKGTGGTGNARIGGLPFTVRNTAGQAPAASPRFGAVTLSPNYSFVVGGFNPGTATAGFLQIGSGQPLAGFDWAACLADTSEIAISGGYFV